MTTPNGSGVTNRGTNYADGSQVTSTNINDHVDDAVFNDNAVDDTTIGLNTASPKALFVKNSGIDTQQLADDAVTQGKTSFIDANGVMTLSGDDPKLVLDDTSNETEDNGFIQSFISGSMHIETTKAGSDVHLSPKDALIVKNDGTERFRVDATAAKNQDGTDAAGAKVDGGLYVTGDVYADEHLVADNLKLIGNAPTIKFDQDDETVPNSYISGDSVVNAIETRVQRANGDIINTTVDNFTAKVCDDATADFDATTNPYVERFRVAHDAGMDLNGTLADGAKVTGTLQVTDDTTILGKMSIRETTPELYFIDTANTDEQPRIKSYESGTIEVLSEKAASAVILDGKASVQLEVDGSDKFVVSETASKNASGTSNQPGGAVTGNLFATGDISANGDVVASLSSDKRLKDNIAPIQDATSKVTKLSGNTFDWNDKSKYTGSDVGVIAQEVQEIIPSAVKETEEGYLKVEYTKIVPLLIESIKELSAKVQELEAKVK